MRPSWKYYLFSLPAFRAWLHLAMAIALFYGYLHLARQYGFDNRVLLSILFTSTAPLLLSAGWHFFSPTIAPHIRRLLKSLKREKAEYPCPVCGYDIRYTPHRCP